MTGVVAGAEVYVAAAYGATAAVLGGLTAWAWLRARRWRRRAGDAGRGAP